MDAAAAKGVTARAGINSTGGSAYYDTASGTTVVTGNNGNITYDNRSSDYSSDWTRSGGGSGSTTARSSGTFDAFEVASLRSSNSVSLGAAVEEATRQYLINENEDLLDTLQNYGYTILENSSGVTVKDAAGNNFLTDNDADGVTYQTSTGETATVSLGTDADGSPATIKVAGARDTVYGFQIITKVGDTSSTDVILIKQADGTAEDENHTGKYSTVGYVSNAYELAKKECESRGLPVNDYNIFGMISELYLGVDETISHNGTDYGMSLGGESVDYETGMSSFASYLTQHLDGEKFSDFQSTYDMIKSYETSDAATTLKTLYLKYQNEPIPSEKFATIADKMAALEAIHQ